MTRHIGMAPDMLHIEQATCGLSGLAILGLLPIQAGLEECLASYEGGFFPSTIPMRITSWNVQGLGGPIYMRYRGRLR